MDCGSEPASGGEGARGRGKALANVKRKSILRILPCVIPNQHSREGEEEEIVKKD
jgi:hypothetical protein